MTAEPPIALSTGWHLEHPTPSFESHQQFAEIVDGFELQFGVGLPERFEVYDRPLPGDWDLSYCTLHLPPTPSQYVSRFSALTEQYSPSTAVFHPTSEAVEQEIRACLDADIPASLENMDGQSNCGYEPAELAEYFDEYDLQFTLDVQHVYEHDPSMEYGWTLLDVLGDDLVQLHVSGETETNGHALVSEARNREEILSFVEEIFDDGYEVPIILEGKYDTVADVEREYTLLDNRLR